MSSQFQTAREWVEAVRTGRQSAVSRVQESLDAADTVGRSLNAFITLCQDKALAQAAAVDSLSVAEKKNLPLCGVAVAVKDNISYTGYPMTCGSRMLDDYRPPYDATVVGRLIEAGAAIIGKTNLDEFAMGSSSETSSFGPVANPLFEGRTTGGSSGGSAAAVAAGIVPLALGSDTGGSVRQPAVFCGVYGLRPTYGSVSRYGLTAFCSSTDQIGPIARTVGDLQLLYSVIAGQDSSDATSCDKLATERRRSDDRLTIGLPNECLSDQLAAEIADAVQSAARTLEARGCRIKTVSLPLTKYAIPAYYLIASAEASTNLARFDGVRFGLRAEKREEFHRMISEVREQGFGSEVKRRIMLGTYALSAGYYDEWYARAVDIRSLILEEFKQCFNTIDALLTPVTPTLPFLTGEKADDPAALAVPSSTPGAGVQLMADRFSEDILFRLARMLEGDS
jgi:aspartyl-tRNA(Asn)/glutamyl-tRNA(Gln) amidotransferase subunit A